MWFGSRFLMQNTQNGTVGKTESTKLSKKVGLKNGIGTVMVRSSEKFGKHIYCIPIFNYDEIFL